MPHDMHYQKEYLECLERILGGRCFCLRLLLKEIQELTKAKGAALILWREESLSVVSAVPDICEFQKYVRPSHVKRLLQEYLESREAGPGDASAISYQMRGRKHELLLLRLPIVFPPHAEDAPAVMCLADRLIKASPLYALEHLHAGHVQYAVQAWASHMVHLRAELHWICQRLFELGIPGKHKIRTGTISNTLQQLRRVLSLDDIVQVVESLLFVQKADSNPVEGPLTQLVSGELPRMLKDVAGERFEELRLCAPPHWPPNCELCDWETSRREDLITWVGWRNTTRKDFVDGVPKNLPPLLKALPKLALNAVEPSTNLLPHGLQSYVLSCGKDSWVRNRMKFWNSGAASTEELVTATTSVARVIHNVVGGLRFDDKTFQAIIWLLSEYAHHALGVPQQIDLRTHLLQAARGEPALQVLRDFYRDHFFHALEVCFLGHFLLEMTINCDNVAKTSSKSKKNRARGEKAIWELAADKMGLQGAKDDRHQILLRLWYTASLLHDVGYGIDVLKGARTLLRFLGGTKPMKSLLNRLDAALTELSKDMEAAGLTRYTAADKPGEDHGIVAAWHLEHLLREAATTDATIHCKDYAPAIRAIAMHNSRKHRVSFADDPLAFLLILCDSLQEWHRPRLGFATSPGLILSWMKDTITHEASTSSTLQSLQIKSLTKRRGSFFLQSGQPLQFVLAFSDEIKWNAGVFNLWLDASCNFQRLDFAGLPNGFDVEVRYCTPAFTKNGSEHPEQQLHRLRDAAQETHMTFLNRWFPNSPSACSRGTTNGSVTWRPSQAGRMPESYESLTLHLRKLSETNPITGSIDDFRKHLRNWKYYNEDREYGGDYAAPEAIF